MNVLLIHMPFGALDRPALGISLLKSALTARGHVCDIRYLNLDLARDIGVSLYDRVADGIPYTAFAGDWCFTLPLYGRRPAEDRNYVEQVLRRTWQLDPGDIADLLALREYTPEFLTDRLREVPWQDYGLIGFRTWPRWPWRDWSSAISPAPSPCSAAPISRT